MACRTRYEPTDVGESLVPRYGAIVCILNVEISSRLNNFLRAQLCAFRRGLGSAPEICTFSNLKRELCALFLYDIPTHSTLYKNRKK